MKSAAGVGLTLIGIVRFFDEYDCKNDPML